MSDEVDQQAEDDFKAGFESVTEDGTEETVEEESTEESGASETEGEKPEAAEEQKPLFAGVTEEQFRALLAKAAKVDELEQRLIQTSDKVFGKFGAVNEAILELKKQSPVAKQPAKFAPEKFKRLSKDYPELAEALAGDLSESFEVEPEQQPEQPSQQAPNLNAILAGMEQKMEQRMRENTMDLLRPDWRMRENTMDLLRPDWRNVVVSPDFRIYKSTLPEQEQVKFDSSWDPQYIHSVIDQFDAWREKSAAPVRSKPDPSKRLRQSIQPRGTSTDHVLSDDDAFAEGFNSVRRARL